MLCEASTLQSCLNSTLDYTPAERTCQIHGEGGACLYDLVGGVFELTQTFQDENDNRYVIAPGESFRIPRDAVLANYKPEETIFETYARNEDLGFRCVE